jgi:hypothetical protein
MSTPTACPAGRSKDSLNMASHRRPVPSRRKPPIGAASRTDELAVVIENRVFLSPTAWKTAACAGNRPRCGSLSSHR